MKNTKKIVALVLNITLLIGVLAGCAKKEETKKATDKNKKVSIVFWEQDDSNVQKVLDGLVKDFQEENPNITIKKTHYDSEELRKSYTAASLETNGPDIVLGLSDNIGIFAKRSLIQPIEDIMGSDLDKTYDKDSLEAAKYEGKLYMLPDRKGNELILAYNKKLVSKAPKTFEEVIEISKKLKAEGKVQYGIAERTDEPFYSIPFLGAFGGKVFDNTDPKAPKLTLDTQAVKEWMEYFYKLHTDGIIPKEADYDIMNNLFKEGKTAFIINGPWGLEDYKKANIDFDIVSLPTISGKYPTPYSAVTGYTVSSSVKDEDKKEAVKKFLTFLNTKESQLKMANAHKQLPSNLKALKDEKITKDPLIVGQKDQLDKTIPLPIIPQMTAVWDAIKSVQQEVLTGRLKPEDSASKMQKKAEEGMKALGF